MNRLLLGLLLSSIALAAFLPGSALAAEYNTFVGCDDESAAPVPSHACLLGDHPAAYLEADEETEYEVCVEFPNLEFLCGSALLAEAGILYQDSIETGEAGQLYVYWYLAGTDTEIGFWAYEMQNPPPPAPPPPLSISFSSPPPPPPSAECLKAQDRVRKLKARLRLANCSCQERKIRPRLRKARAAVKRLC
jgi:hypothetical protein